MIFGDTSAWYAVEVEDDINHKAARAFLSQLASGKHGVSVTTDYVLDETLTLLRSRRGLEAAVAFIDKVRKSKSLRLFWTDEGLFEKALIIFRATAQKSWSFTDCTSFAFVRELALAEAFAFDKHFGEAGFRTHP